MSLTFEEKQLFEANKDWWIKVRRNGELLDILNTEKQDGDIFVGNILDEKSKIKADMIRVYRGGDTSIIHASEKKDDDIIEYTYTKNELYNDNGKCAIKTDEMLNQDKMDYYIEIRNELIHSLSDLIQGVKIGEDNAVKYGVITDDDRKLKDELYIEWEKYFASMYAKQDTVDIAKYEMKDINYSNTDLFDTIPEFPDNIVSKKIDKLVKG